jgi:dimethylaniline monooxygenase (N-oxide forming)
VNQPTSLIVQSEPLDAIRSGEVVKVYRKDITALSDSNVILDDGSCLRTDLLIYATGYRIAPTMFSPSDAAHLGLPVPVSHVPPAEEKKWSRLDAEADGQVCRLFPRLLTAPTPPHTPHTHPPQRAPILLLPPSLRGGGSGSVSGNGSGSSGTGEGEGKGELVPHRLYRTVLPPSSLDTNDRSFAVVGAIAASATAVVAEAVALWAVAWLTGHLDVKGTRTVDDVEKEIALANAFKARRYLQVGRRSPTVMFEWLSVRLFRSANGPNDPYSFILFLFLFLIFNILFGFADRADSWWMTCC